MEKYRTLHLWMLVPMVFMQVGIFHDYWGDFSTNAWSVHVHYWTGTAWYLYLILQPYLATHGQLARHRTNGIIGVFLAGGVCLTAFSMMHRDIANAERAVAFPERFGPFQPWFFHGVAVVELVMMAAFGLAVLQGILRRKELESHAWWMVSTVFLIMMPALGRGVQNLYIGLHRTEMPNVDIMVPLYLTQGIIFGLLLLAAWKFGKLRHPATGLAVGVNLVVLLLEPIGRAPGVQSLLQAAIRG